MRILLVRAKSDLADGVRHSVLEHLGIGHLAAVLRQEEHEVEVLDGQIEGLEHAELAEEIKFREFDLLGLTVPDFASVHPSLRYPHKVCK